MFKQRVGARKAKSVLKLNLLTMKIYLKDRRSDVRSPASLPFEDHRCQMSNATGCLLIYETYQFGIFKPQLDLFDKNLFLLFTFQMILILEKRLKVIFRFSSSRRLIATLSCRIERHSDQDYHAYRSLLFFRLFTCASSRGASSRFRCDFIRIFTRIKI